MLRIFLIMVVMFFVTLAAHGLLGSVLSRGRPSQTSINLYYTVAYGLGALAAGLSIWSFMRPAGRRWLIGSAAAGALAGAVLSFFAVPLYF
jgi:hypothetical protein